MILGETYPVNLTLVEIFEANLSEAVYHLSPRDTAKSVLELGVKIVKTFGKVISSVVNLLDYKVVELFTSDQSITTLMLMANT